MNVVDQLVDCKLVTDGLVVDQVVRRRGDIVKVTADQRDRLIRERHARPLPLVRMLVDNRIVGTRVTAAGDVVTMENPIQAREWHAKGLADWLNASEMGEILPVRKVEDPNSKYARRVRATKRFTRGAWRPTTVEPGDFLDIEQLEAMELIGKGLVEPFGWTPESPPKIALRATRGGVSLGNRGLAKGEIGETSDPYEAMRKLADGSVEYPLDEPAASPVGPSSGRKQKEA